MKFAEGLCASRVSEISVVFCLVENFQPLSVENMSSELMLQQRRFLSRPLSLRVYHLVKLFSHQERNSRTQGM